jgi:large subunit ribosomal protein L21
MYAIIADGGRQLKVEPGQELSIDYRDDLSPGQKVTFDRVLAVSDGNGDVKIGTPTVSGAAVVAEVVGVDQGPKLTVQKFRRRKNSRRHNGHRSIYTRVRIEKIAG